MNAVNTFAICDSNNEIYVLHSAPNDRVENAVKFGTMIVNQTGYATTCAVTLDTGREITLKWAVLYEGEYTAETLPPYVPKGYTHELLECQRYYQQSYVGSSVDAVKGTLILIGANPNWLQSVNFPVPMRCAPTVTIYDNTTGNPNAISIWNNDQTVSGVSAGGISEKGFIPLKTNGITTNVSYGLHYTASADL